MLSQQPTVMRRKIPDARLSKYALKVDMTFDTLGHAPKSFVNAENPLGTILRDLTEPTGRREHRYWV